MSNKVVIQVKEDPIIIRMAKQGAIGRPGPAGEAGEDGTAWELTMKMVGSPDGECKVAIYRNGELYTATSVYIEVYTLEFGGLDFVLRPNLCNNMVGDFLFTYTNTQSCFVIAYEDSSKEKVLCSNSANYGKAASIAIGQVKQGATPKVTNVGTPHDAILNFTLQKGDAATVAVGNVSTLPFGARATVVNVGTNNDAVFDFGIPNGAGTGCYVDEPIETLFYDAGALFTPVMSSDGVLSWTNNAELENPEPVRIALNPRGEWSSTATYTNPDVVKYQGSSYFAKKSVPAGTKPTNTSYWIKMVDKGDAATVAVGTVTTGQPGSSVVITNRGTNTDAIFDFTIPKGQKGDTGTISVGTVTTGSAGSNATVVNSGTNTDAVFDFSIPRGTPATVTVGTVSTGTAGSRASVTNRGTSGNAILDFVIPRGENGDGYTGAQVDEPNKMLLLERTQNMLSEMAFVDDAPSDSKDYARKNGEWVQTAPLASPTFTGTPKAPTAADGTSTTQIATTAFVQNAFKANDAMLFKGTIGSSGATVTALPATHYQGWTYKVATAGTYAGKVCEIGDTIMCVTDGTSSNNAHWTVIQANIDGAVTGGTSSTDSNVAIFNGTSGRIIKDSGFTIGKSVPSNAKFTDTTYTNGDGLSLSGTTFSASFPTSGTPSALGTASNGTSTNVARADHVHAKPAYGNITTAGAITATADIANGDKIVIVDSSNSSKLTGTTITFDGTTTDKALTPKGTWETFGNTYTLPTASSSTKGGVKVGTGLSISSEVLSNSGVRSIATGTANGTISVNTGGTSANVSVKGLGTAAYINDAPNDGNYYARKDNNWIMFADSEGGSTATVAWGGITGSISSQGDLQDALALKASSTHAHGNITNAGAITSDTAVASGDKLIVSDSSASSKLVRTGISFDGSTTTKALTPKGTWETFNNYSLPTASSSTKGGVKVGDGLSISSEVLSNSGVRSIAIGTANGTISVNTGGTSADVSVKGLGTAAYTNSTEYATANHEHTQSDVVSALGYRPASAMTNSDVAIASSCLEVKELYDEDLDDYKPYSTNCYISTNTQCAHTPAGIKSFFMVAFPTSNSYRQQILIERITNNIYTRYFSTAWSDWVKIEITDTKYTASTTSIGSASAGTAISADDITAWSEGTLPTASVENGILSFGMGSLPSLSYTSRSIPNISVTSQTVVTGITEA